MAPVPIPLAVEVEFDEFEFDDLVVDVGWGLEDAVMIPADEVDAAAS